MANPIISLLKEAAEEGTKITSIVGKDAAKQVNALNISKEVSENAAKRAAEAEGRKLTASTVTKAEENVLKPRTVEQLRKEAADEKWFEGQKASFQERLSKAKERRLEREKLPKKERPKFKTNEQAIEDAKQADFSDKIANSYDTPEGIAQIESNVKAKAEAEAQALESERINRIMSSEGEAPEIINQTNRATSTSNNTAQLHMTAGEQNYYNPEWSVTEAGLVSQGKMTPNEVAKERSSRRKNMFDKDFEKRALQKQRNEFNFDESRFDVLDKNPSDTPWSSTARAALGTAVAGGALMAALSSSRGQQNNAQLYGQQPLY